MILLELFYEFFLIGQFTFGGGYAMIPLVKEVSLRREWLSIEQFTSFLGVCESTPGPIAINMATFIGSSQYGILGAIVATIGVVLPSFIIILLIASLLKNFTDNKFFKAFIKGVKPVVIGLIITTGFILLVECFGYVSLNEFNPNYISMICFGLITLIYFLSKKIFKKKLSAVMIILISIVLGIGVSLIFNLL